MSLLTALNTALSLLEGVTRIGIGSYNLKKLYEDWTRISHSPHLSPSQKVRLIARGTTATTDVAVGLLRLTSIGFEYRHRQGLQAFEQAKKDLEICKEPGAQACIEHWEKEIQKSVNTYLQVSGLIDELEKINTGASVIECLHPGNKVHVPQLCVVLLEKGGRMLISSGGAQAYGKELTDRRIGNIASHLVFLVGRALDLQQDVSTSEVQVILNVDQYHLRKYTLPSSANDPSLTYSKIPKKYHSREPLKNFYCPISRAAVTKSLFILSEGIPYLFEKDALVNEIFQAKSEEMPFINCYTQCPYDPLMDLYEDPEFDHALLKAAFEMQNEEIEQMQPQVANSQSQ